MRVWQHLFNRAAQRKKNKTKQLFCFPFFVLVDELFKEANVRFNGNVNYEEFTQMVMLPPVDYWLPDWGAKREGGVFALRACVRSRHWVIMCTLKFQWALLSDFCPLLKQTPPQLISLNRSQPFHFSHEYFILSNYPASASQFVRLCFQSAVCCVFCWQENRKLLIVSVGHIFCE